MSEVQPKDGVAGVYPVLYPVSGGDAGHEEVHYRVEEEGPDTLLVLGRRKV